jgi:hypothetical protein
MVLGYDARVTTITIYGADAIGGLLGAALARAGEAVLLVDRVLEHVEAMNRHGLRITGAGTVVVSMQNGMNPPRLPARLGAARVIAAFVS